MLGACDPKFIVGKRVDESIQFRLGAVLVDPGLVGKALIAGVGERCSVHLGGCLVEGVQARFPGFRFTLLGPADGYDDNLRFSWGLGPEGGEALIKGTDFATLENGRLKTVYGFLDQVPAAA